MNGDEGRWRSRGHPGPEGGDPEGTEQPQESGGGEGLVREGRGLTFGLGHSGGGVAR